MERNNTKIIIGAILILFGIAFLTETTGILRPFGFNIWSLMGLIWPLVLLFFGARMLLQGNSTGGLILSTLGLVFLLTNLFHWNFFGVLWPLVLIALGLSIFFRNENPQINSSTGVDDRDTFDESVAFWGGEKLLKAKSFKKGNISVAFGGYKLDMSDAKIDKKGAKLVLNTAFGGIEIIAPKDCKIVSKGSGVFGGWDNKISSRTTKEPVLEISGTAAFGGIEIKE